MLAMFTRSFSEMLNSVLASALGVQGASNHSVSDFNWILFNAQVRSFTFNICLNMFLIKGEKVIRVRSGETNGDVSLQGLFSLMQDPT